MCESMLQLPMHLFTTVWDGRILNIVQFFMAGFIYFISLMLTVFMNGGRNNFSEGKSFFMLLIRAGHLLYFLIFPIIKNDFCIFCQTNLTGSGLFK